MKNIFEKTPFLGCYNRNCKKFIDENMFDLKHKNYIKLRKVKIWYGLSDASKMTADDKTIGKNILGIQCEYLNSISGEIKLTEMQCGTITDDLIVTKTLDLSNNDYITKFEICYNSIISYIKLETKLNQILELGTYNKDLAKTLKLNSDKEPHILI